MLLVSAAWPLPRAVIWAVLGSDQERWFSGQMLGAKDVKETDRCLASWYKCLVIPAPTCSEKERQ